MKIAFKVYDSSRHCYLKNNEVRIAADGRIWYLASEYLDIWEPVSDTAEDMQLRSVTIIKDGHATTTNHANPPL